MIDRPDQNAPRVAWHLYVFELVTPILAAHDAEFAKLVEQNEELLAMLRMAIDNPDAISGDLGDTALATFEGLVAELVAKAQAAFDSIAYGGKGNEPLVQAVAAAFAPHSLLGGHSRWWWEHGLNRSDDSDDAAYFAPGAGPEAMCETIYQEEYERRRLGPEVLAEAQQGALNDTAEIQRAAGIGLFQSSPEDSESAESDTEGIRDAAGIGLFQTAVPKVKPEPQEP